MYMPPPPYTFRYQTALRDKIRRAAWFNRRSPIPPPPPSPPKDRVIREDVPPSFNSWSELPGAFWRWFVLHLHRQSRRFLLAFQEFHHQDLRFRR